jgi:four helix bundle protein
MYTYPFEKLEVWELSKKLVVKIYKLSKDFPLEEKFGLINQMRRAAVSICSNLAEGSGRNTPKDQANFYGMAYSSLLEVLNQLLIPRELGWLEEAIYLDIRKDIENISIRINGLRKSTFRD